MSTVGHSRNIGNVTMAMGAPCLNSEVSANNNTPEKYEGYVLKKKKWPLKGWHRRYFFLHEGFLKYAKSPHGITKNKLHGLMDMGLSVMSIKKNALTIDLDTEDTIFHLKLKSPPMFQLWVSKLRLHRDFRLVEMKKDMTLTSGGNHKDFLQFSSEISFESAHVPLDRERLQKCNSYAPVSFLSSCHQISAPLSYNDDVINKKECYCTNELSSQDLKEAQHEILLLGKLFDDLQQLTPSVVAEMIASMPPPSSPSLSKKERKYKKTSKKLPKQPLNVTNSLSLPPVETSITPFPSSAASTPNMFASQQFHAHNSLQFYTNISRSNPDLSVISVPTGKTLHLEDEWKQNYQTSKSVSATPVHTNASRSALSLEFTTMATPFNGRLRDLTEKQNKFLCAASKVQGILSVVAERVKSMEETQQNQSNSTMLRNNVSQLTNENKELRAKLQRIHTESFTNDAPMTGTNVAKRMIGSTRPMLSQSESQLSINETSSEMFYDAEEYLISDEESSSDEESETGDDGASSEISDGSETTSSQSLVYEVEEALSVPIPGSIHRDKLPCHKPDTDVSLWNILKKNIGKDLSKVAMPVTLNEPLNALQLLCEEIEYSNLLDKASECADQYERMLYVAAFAISAYGSTYTRAGQKPFNPILGETYECVRDDKSFRFVAEQVSHHPPISACHCDGASFEYWQDARFKNKFWGKSMEVFPIGSVHVKLKKQEAEYQWKKVTSCVHNIMSGTRWIEHYGDMIIKCGGDTCKISFSKSGYWNNKNGEVNGVITDEGGVVRHKLYGKWFEGIYCDVEGKTRCLWRPNPMPVDYGKQYGFTRFAIELNELETSTSHLLPTTDTRFRPDQRCLEEGDVPGAEKQKIRVEQLQREQKKQREQQGINYESLFFKKISIPSEEDTWLFKGDYWKLRQDPGFEKFKKLPKLW